MMAPDAPCELNIELSMMRMWGDVHDGKWLSCMAGDAMMWPAASSKITAPNLLERETQTLKRGAGGAAAPMHAPQHIDVKRRPVHRQTGSLRVHAAEDALHTRVEKQAGRRRLAQDDVLKIWEEGEEDG